MNDLERGFEKGYREGREHGIRDAMNVLLAWRAEYKKEAACAYSPAAESATRATIDIEDDLKKLLQQHGRRSRTRKV